MADLKIHRLSTRDSDFRERFDRLTHWTEERGDAVENTVRDIIGEVRNRGDAALVDLTDKFDRLKLSSDQLAFTAEEIDAAFSQVGEAGIAALEQAAERIRSFHKNQQQEAFGYEDETGTFLGQRVRPIERVGLYVPGGKAAYPSSVLMNAIPAAVAGVNELVMVVPTPDGVVNPLVLAAARIAGVTTIFKIGGAQAVAALAYGTESVPAVDKIVGPGNAWVAEAKRQVFGQVGIDMIAGPSEILVIADNKNDPRWIAADLLSQAEHDEVAQAVLITDDAVFADAVGAAISEHLETLGRREICEKSLAARGALIVADDLIEGCRLASEIATEHLELAVEDPDALLDHVESAGAIFLGRYTPEAIGDYMAGPNHVLPTSRTARFSSPLGVYDFVKRTSLIRCSADSVKKIGPAASVLADREGLTAHKLSVDLRLEGES